MHGPLVWCLRCGAYFWRQACSLALPCDPGKRAAQLNRLNRGLFPSAVARHQSWRIITQGQLTPGENEVFTQQLATVTAALASRSGLKRPSAHLPQLYAAGGLRSGEVAPSRAGATASQQLAGYDLLTLEEAQSFATKRCR